MDTETVIKTEPDSCEDVSQCRLCATVSPTALNIYGEQGIANRTSEKINLYLPTKVSPFDRLTLSCCWNCYRTVNGWHEFVERCVSAETALKCSVQEENEVKVDCLDVRLCTVKSEVFVEEVEEGYMNSEFVAAGEGKDNSEFVLKCEIDFENARDTTVCQEHPQGINGSEHSVSSTTAGEDKTTCDHCKSSFANETELEFHNCPQSGDAYEGEEFDIIEVIEGTHYCEECNISFKSNRGLQIHHAKRHQKDVKPVKNAKRMNCQDCGIFYNSMVNYKAHIYSMHTANPQPLTQEEKWRDWELMKSECKVVDEFNKVLYKCPECSKLFNRASFLMNHQATHTGAQLYSCKLCEKKFSHRQSLSSHVKVRHGDKKLECEICGQKFGKKSFLLDHMLVHKGEKTFICEKCGKSFAQRNGLRIHLRSHDGGLPQFECALCKRRFFKDFEYRRHLELHKVERPFRCEKCGAHFQREQDVEDHMVKHEGPNEFFCQFCGACFSRKNNLYKHLRMCIYRLS